MQEAIAPVMEGRLMSFVFTAPEFVVNAAGDLANIGSTITAANGVVAIASLFSSQGR